MGVGVFVSLGCSQALSSQMAPWQEAIQVSFNMVGPKQEEPKGCLPKRVSVFGGEPTKQKLCFFVVVDPCLDQGSLKMPLLGG